LVALPPALSAVIMNMMGSTLGLIWQSISPSVSENETTDITNAWSTLTVVCHIYYSNMRSVETLNIYLLSTFDRFGELVLWASEQSCYLNHWRTQVWSTDILSELYEWFVQNKQELYEWMPSSGLRMARRDLQPCALPWRYRFGVPILCWMAIPA
jgi:hypothetical protein